MNTIEELHARYDRWHAQGVPMVRKSDIKPKPNPRPWLKPKRTVIRDDGKTYPSLCAAAKDHDVYHAAIRDAILNGTRCKGHQWRYAA